MVWLTILKRILSVLCTALLSERAIIKMILVCGDYLVKRTTNDLDDKAWEVVKGELEASLEK